MLRGVVWVMLRDFVAAFVVTLHIYALRYDCVRYLRYVRVFVATLLFTYARLPLLVVVCSFVYVPFYVNFTLCCLRLRYMNSRCVAHTLG